MSKRLTQSWTATSEGAFGESGAKGDRGEDFLMEVFQQWGWESKLHRGLDSKQAQVSGIDISFRKPTWSQFYTADVKSNLTESGMFYIETQPHGWLFNPKKTSDRIWHVNPDTKMMAWYDRVVMINHIRDNSAWNSGLYRMDLTNTPSFVTRR